MSNIIRQVAEALLRSKEQGTESDPLMEDLKMRKKKRYDDAIGESATDFSNEMYDINEDIGDMDEVNAKIKRENIRKYLEREYGKE